MIDRYTRPEFAEIWRDRTRYLAWLKVEHAVCAEIAREGGIPRAQWRTLDRKLKALERQGGVDPKRVDHFERETKHDVIAFTTAVAERIGPISRYVHFGLTSSDVVDTALSMMIRDAGAIIRADIVRLIATLKRRAIEFKRLPTIGRSHGIFAEPTSFGLKFLGWHQEWTRNLARLDAALANCRYGKLSGAVGVNPHFGPQFEARVLKRLGLEREPVSTQVIPRDRHAELLSVLALCGASMERISVELRHLQRSEVGEVMEGFAAGQKGSSAMPHKRNPISTENLTGCARMLRAYAHPGFENVALWHERDISHSSAERIALPDATILLDYALNRLERVISGLVVHEERVKANLMSAGKIAFSGHFLLALVEKGATRENAYRWVQRAALASLESGRSGESDGAVKDGVQKDFLKLLSADPEIARRLTPARIAQLGSMDYQLRHVGKIFDLALQVKRSGRARR